MRLVSGLALAAGLLAAPPRAGAETVLPDAKFDQHLVTDVTGAALSFIAPRTLEAIPLAQLSLWGLRGLTTLDPHLSAELRDSELRLLMTGREGTQGGAPGGMQGAPQVLLARTIPAVPDGGVWGAMLGDLAKAAWNASALVRHAGTDGMVEAFFDEICNHLDAYSRYETPAETTAERSRREGQAGIGLDTVARDDGFFVSRVVPDGPAAQANVRVGDEIVSIDGESLEGAVPEEVTDLLAGPDNTSVVLELRDRRGRSRSVALDRAVLLPRTVASEWRGRMLVLHVTGFAADTGSQLADALSEPLVGPAAGSAVAAMVRAPRGIVVDLRGNRGGLLRQAVAAAETLLVSGLVVVTVGRDPAASHEFHAVGSDLAHGLPVVVLVDGGSASAAEILAAALADQRRAVVVGSSTRGKGLVQAVGLLPNGAELLLTWSRVLAPLGWPIQGLGVLPQVCTSLGAEAAEAQLAALAKGSQPMHDMLQRHRAARPPLSSEETLDIRSACPATEGRDGDFAAARFLIDHPDAYATALIGPPSP